MPYGIRAATNSRRDGISKQTTHKPRLSLALHGNTLGVPVEPMGVQSANHAFSWHRHLHFCQRHDAKPLFISLSSFGCPVLVPFQVALCVLIRSCVGEGMEPGRTYLECHLGFVGGDDRDVYHAGHNCTTQETKAPGSSVFYSPAAAGSRAAGRGTRSSSSAWNEGACGARTAAARGPV